MYQRVLVPIDGSHFSEEVLPYAAAVARGLGVQLSLVRAIENPANLDKATAQLRDLTDAWEAEHLLIPGRGNVSGAIQEEADRVPDTLLAMTTHGRSGLAEAMLGSVTRAVVRTGQEPVLVYHPTERHREQAEELPEIKTVVLPLDGSERSDSVQEVAAEWAKAFGATLEVIQVVRVPLGHTPAEVVSDPNRTSLVSSRAAELAETYGIEARWEVLHGDPADAIIEHIGRRDGVLVVMATRGNAGLRATVLGSVTGEILRRSGVPMLIRRG